VFFFFLFIFIISQDCDSQHVSELRPGKADINVEIPAKFNPRFVLHDSLGFEAGDVSNFEIVQEFIKSRNQQPDLKDQLHAIW